MTITGLVSLKCARPRRAIVLFQRGGDCTTGSFITVSVYPVAQANAFIQKIGGVDFNDPTNAGLAERYCGRRLNLADAQIVPGTIRGTIVLL